MRDKNREAVKYSIERLRTYLYISVIRKGNGREEKIMIPVYSPEKIYEDKPDYMLILAWNFADENMEQQAEFKEMGGKFIISVPEVRVI